MRRKAVWIGLLLLALSSTVEAQTFPSGTSLTVAWDPPIDEATSGVNSYRIRIDAQTFPANVAIPQATYRWGIPQSLVTVGTHTVGVSACRDAACGPELTAAFTIEVPLPGMPRAPGDGGGVIRPTPTAALTVPQAIEYVNAYALWAIDRPTTPAELSWLATRHPAEPPTKYSILRLMDEAYAAVGR